MIKPLSRLVRFTTKRDTLYVIQLEGSNLPLEIKSLGPAAKLLEGDITGVHLLGSEGPVKWTRTEAALAITAPGQSDGNRLRRLPGRHQRQAASIRSS